VKINCENDIAGAAIDHVGFTYAVGFLSDIGSTESVG